MRLTTLPTSTKCDFCSAPFDPGTPRWLYNVHAVTILTTGPNEAIADDGMWAACDACAEDIRVGAPHRLAVNAVRRGYLERRGRSFSEHVRATIEVHGRHFWRPWLQNPTPQPPLRVYD